MNTTIISIVIILVILSIFLFINFDYKSKYKKSEKHLYYEALDLLLLGKLKEAYATLLALIKNDTENVKAYLPYLFKEIDMLFNHLNENNIKLNVGTIFFGGGSPTIFNREDLKNLVD